MEQFQKFGITNPICAFLEKNKEEKIAGGIYLFSNKEDAKRYSDKHTARLQSFGYKDIRAKIFDVNLPLSKISSTSNNHNYVKIKKILTYPNF